MRRLAVCLALALLFVHNVAAQETLEDPAAEPTAPDGWWLSLSDKPGKYCGLRDFPPIPNGYGSARVLCGYSYNHEFIFNVRKVDMSGQAEGGWDVTTGDPIYLRNFNPMLTWCSVSGNNPVRCGFGYGKATNFTIEKVDTADPSINILSDRVYLKAPGSGNRYCKVTYRGSSSFIYCNSAKRSATKFAFPANSYSSISLANVLSGRPCGGVFHGYSSDPSFVNCTVPFDNDSNFPQRFSYTFKTPSASNIIRAGRSIALKSYDTVYHYHMVSWAVGAPGNSMQLAWNSPTTKRQWLTLVKVQGSSEGDELQSGDVVAIKSDFVNRYCGVDSIIHAAIQCDIDPATRSADSLPDGYKFEVTIN